jgi:tetratricopeptide (TPR) repeat protein
MRLLHSGSPVPALIGALLLVPLASAGDDPCRAGAQALERRDPASAEALLRQCVAAHPDQLAPYLQLCAAYQLQGKSAELEAAAAAGLKRFPDEKRFYFTVGTRAGQQKRFERALEVFGEGFRRWPDDLKFRENLASAHVGRGLELLDAGRNAEAEKHLRRATELDPQDVEAQLNLGRALHNSNRSVEALAAFDRVLALDSRLELAHFHRGMVLYGLGEYQRAIADLEREIEIDPGYPPSYLFRGLAKIAQGEWTQALADLDEAARRMPDNAKAHYARARCLAQLGRGAGAEAAFRRTIELDPSDPAPMNALGRVLQEAGRAEEAESLFRKAAQLDKKLRGAGPGEIRFESPARKPR